MPQQCEEQFDKLVETMLKEAFGLTSPQMIVGTLICYWYPSAPGSCSVAERCGMTTISALGIDDEELTVYVNISSFLHHPLQYLRFHRSTGKWTAYVKNLEIDRLVSHPVVVRLEPFGSVQGY